MNTDNSLYLKNYIQSEFSRMKSNSIFWFCAFFMTAIVVMIRVVAFFLVSHQFLDYAGEIVTFSERMPVFLSLIQSDYDISSLMYALFLFIFPLVNSIVYASSISFERKYGVSKAISVRLPVHINYIGKLVVSFTLSLLLFLYVYLLDMILVLIIHPINGTGYFKDYSGNIFDIMPFNSHISGVSVNQYLFFIEIMFLSALVFALYSAITCSLAFLTRLKYPMIVLSAMMIGFFSMLVFDFAGKPFGLHLQNFAIGRISYFYFLNSQSVSPMIGISGYIIAVLIFVLLTYRHLKIAGDIY